MILTRGEDTVLRVYDSVAEAIADVEALDAEASFQVIYDHTGEVYGIEWIRPNSRGRWFRFVVTNGIYTLLPTGRKDVGGLLRLLRNAPAVDPPEVRARLKDLERLLSA